MLANVVRDFGILFFGKESSSISISTPLLTEGEGMEMEFR